MHIIYEIFMLGNSLFGTSNLNKNADFDKYKYFGYGIWFDASGSFSLPDVNGFSKNVIIFSSDMISSVYVDNKKNYILILGKGPTEGLDDATLTPEEEYSINVSEKHKNFPL